MKFNWGTAIVIVFALFISYIMYMVITMMSTHTDIVETDYYAQQIDYQATKEALEKGMELNLEVVQSESTFDIVFPQEANINKLQSGQMHFYRAENASLDRKITMNPELGNIIQVPLTELEKGNYTLKIRWNDGDTDFFVEKEIEIK